VPWVEDDLQPLNHGDPEDDDSALDLGDPLAGGCENAPPAPAGKRQYLMLNDVCGLASWGWEEWRLRVLDLHATPPCR
jgi:hypothetical protein